MKSVSSSSVRTGLRPIHCFSLRPLSMYALRVERGTEKVRLAIRIDAFCSSIDFNAKVRFSADHRERLRAGLVEVS